jgi:hypothetical protein
MMMQIVLEHAYRKEGMFTAYVLSWSTFYVRGRLELRMELFLCAT